MQTAQPQKPYPVRRYSDVYRQAKRNPLIQLLTTPSTQQRLTFNIDKLKPHYRGPLRPGGPRLRWYQTTLLEYWQYLQTVSPYLEDPNPTPPFDHDNPVHIRLIKEAASRGRGASKTLHKRLIRKPSDPSSDEEGIDHSDDALTTLHLSNYSTSQPSTRTARIHHASL